MHRGSLMFLKCGTAAFLLLGVLWAQPASAQPRDFLFGRPHGTVALRTGWMFAHARSDLFAFVQEQLTVDRKDFNAPAIGVDVDLGIGPRVNAVAGFDFAGSSTSSQYRHLVDNARLPIRQVTALRQMNLSGTLKFAITSRGREISARAWIPAAVTPYVGVGGGLLWYEFKQHGDFVDFADSSVFAGAFRSSGWTPSAQLLGGIDVKGSRHIYFSGEARYLWAHAEPDGTFLDFDPIDLTGFKVTGGIRYLF